MLPKNPFADSQASKPSESTTSGVTQPLAVAPEIHKPADTPAATSNGSAAAPLTASAGPEASESSNTGLNGSANKFEPVVPEEAKQASDPAPVADPNPAPSTEKPSSSISEAPATALSTNSNSEVPTSSSASGQPPVMTGALPLGDQSKPAASEPKPSDSTQHDGVEDVPGANVAPKPAGTSETVPIKDASEKPTATSAPESSALNGGEQNDAGKNDILPPAAPAPIDASIGTGPGSSLSEKKDNDVKDGGVSASAFTAEPSTAAFGEKNDVEMKDATPLAPAEKPSNVTSLTASGEKKDVEMEDAGALAPSVSTASKTADAPAASSDKNDAGIKDAPSATSASTAAPISSAPEVAKPATAPAIDITGITSTTAAPPTSTTAAPNAVAEPVTGAKRKADTDADAADADKAPAQKKQKGPFAKVVAKAKGAVHDMKEKANTKRKNKKETKERPPVGRTERKTRSQGRVE